MILYIRTDGNSEVGTGHVIRCLSIAQAERRRGGECTFITADRQMESLIRESGFGVICLNSAWNDLDKETGKIEQLIAEHKIKRLLIDSYFVTQEYLERLHRLTYLIYMDDINRFVYPCSELVNYNIYAESFDYPSRYPSSTVLKLGPKYAPLREEFIGLPPRVIREKVETVLVSAGGSDRFNAAGQFVERASQNTDISRLHYHIVAGGFNKHISNLNALAEKYPNITVHDNVSNMAPLMCSCDIAVSAGGSTLYELCACGTPTVVFAVADNQLAAIEAFSNGYMLGCGDFRLDEKKCLCRMIAGVDKLVKDYGLRKGIADRCSTLIHSLA